VQQLPVQRTPRLKTKPRSLRLTSEARRCRMLSGSFIRGAWRSTKPSGSRSSLGSDSRLLRSCCKSSKQSRCSTARAQPEGQKSDSAAGSSKIQLQNDRVQRVRRQTACCQSSKDNLTVAFDANTHAQRRQFQMSGEASGRDMRSTIQRSGHAKCSCGHAKCSGHAKKMSRIISNAMRSAVSRGGEGGHKFENHPVSLRLQQLSE